MAPSNKRLGIFGGSFNPVHFGHLALAQEACLRLELEQVLFIPAARNPLRSGTPSGASDTDRLEMLLLACAGNPRFAVDSRELERGGTSYTLDTLKELRSVRPEADLFLLMGADSALSLPEWKGIGEYGPLCTVVVFNRPGEPNLSEVMPEALLVLGLRFNHLPLPPLAISSSGLRRRAALGEPVRYFTPDAVAAYIEERGLYRGI